MWTNSGSLYFREFWSVWIAGVPRSLHLGPNWRGYALLTNRLPDSTTIAGSGRLSMLCIVLEPEEVSGTLSFNQFFFVMLP